MWAWILEYFDGPFSQTVRTPPARIAGSTIWLSRDPEVTQLGCGQVVTIVCSRAIEANHICENQKLFLRTSGQGRIALSGPPLSSPSNNTIHLHGIHTPWSFSQFFYQIERFCNTSYFNTANTGGVNSLSEGLVSFSDTEMCYISTATTDLCWKHNA